MTIKHIPDLTIMERSLMRYAATGVLALSLMTPSPMHAQQTMLGRDLNVFAQNTGNPVIPAYLADASIVYDEHSDMFYAYGTNDGGGIENVYPTQMWMSKDCRRWENRPLALPKSWTDLAGTKCVWAPSFIYNPSTGKYYLMYGIDSKTFIAMADSPTGPWADANALSPGNYFYRGYDAQSFLDDDGQMYITTALRPCSCSNCL